MRESRINRDILSSTLARIVAFFLLAISATIGIIGLAGTVILGEYDAYTSGISAMIHDCMTSYIWDEVGYAKILYQGENFAGLEEHMKNSNVSMEIYDTEDMDKVLWSNYDGKDTQYSFNCYSFIYVTEEQEVEISGTDSNDGTLYVFPESETPGVIDLENENVAEETMDEESATTTGTELVSVRKEFLFKVYVDDSFPYEDQYKTVYTWGMFLADYMYLLPMMAVLGILLAICCFTFLMCSAGHHRGQEGITGGVLYFFHFDVITLVFGGVALFGLMIQIPALEDSSFAWKLVAVGLLIAEVIWCTIYCMEVAVELKMGTIFKHTLCYNICCLCGRSIKAVGKCCVTMVRGLPLVMTSLIGYGAFCILELFALIFFCSLWSIDGDVIILCILEKFILLPVVIYFALVCKRLQKGSEALAEGNLSYELDTSKMLLGFKEHGDNLNRIGEGIAVAVEERMRSEHLKTELITNVSHDLKTPLTSIINYADLIGTAVSGESESVPGEGTDREKLAEYAEVLLRQSKRLKKLLDDLMEASKATTGNLEVNLAPCEIGVLLSQTVGEYEQRFGEKQLELIVRQPENPVTIQADGRHLWRVFDNLMNNICKYAQESTRVYLTVEQEGNMVNIIFRNMSKYPLEISAEELQERFVRGDKSRHMEGNGLGLSIAGSLVELQKGKMEIVTDGDLFKVILRFPINNP